MDEEEYIEIDEETLTNVKWGIVKYIFIFIIFVLVPLLVTILTAKSLSKLNIFASFVGMSIICIDQIVGLFGFLLSMRYEENTENQENN